MMLTLLISLCSCLPLLFDLLCRPSANFWFLPAALIREPTELFLLVSFLFCVESKCGLRC
jgi:hypothetical protein